MSVLGRGRRFPVLRDMNPTARFQHRQRPAVGFSATWSPTSPYWHHHAAGGASRTSASERRRLAPRTGTRVSVPEEGSRASPAIRPTGAVAGLRRNVRQLRTRRPRRAHPATPSPNRTPSLTPEKEGQTPTRREWPVFSGPSSPSAWPGMFLGTGHRYRRRDEQSRTPIIVQPASVATVSALLEHQQPVGSRPGSSRNGSAAPSTPENWCRSCQAGDLPGMRRHPRRSSEPQLRVCWSPDDADAFTAPDPGRPGRALAASAEAKP